VLGRIHEDEPAQRPPTFERLERFLELGDTSSAVAAIEDPPSSHRLDVVAAAEAGIGEHRFRERVIRHEPPYVAVRETERAQRLPLAQCAQLVCRIEDVAPRGRKRDRLRHRR
jgi:hypothetical protein